MEQLRLNPSRSRRSGPCLWLDSSFNSWNYQPLSMTREPDSNLRHVNSELERRLAETTARLEAANNELEAFCYSVSHDLRAPLRSIRGFNEVLAERYSGNLDERGREFLKRACESSRHMDEQIEGLLKLSRAGRAEMSRQPVNVSKMVDLIASDLASGDPDRKVSFEIMPELQAVADERLLRIALDNLLRNAWKFTSKKPDARIEFGAVHEPEPAFFVRDNGAGFDPANSSRLFGVFQRLHSVEEFPGIGAGLAIVQRIISRHGGRVWASGTPENGATFFFTLPADEAL